MMSVVLLIPTALPHPLPYTPNSLLFSNAPFNVHFFDCLSDLRGNSQLTELKWVSGMSVGGRLYQQIISGSITEENRPASPSKTNGQSFLREGGTSLMSPSSLHDGFFFIILFTFDIIIQLQHFSLPFHPSTASHILLSTFIQIHGLFFHSLLLHSYVCMCILIYS